MQANPAYLPIEMSHKMPEEIAYNYTPTYIQFNLSCTLYINVQTYVYSIICNALYILCIKLCTVCIISSSLKCKGAHLLYMHERTLDFRECIKVQGCHGKIIKGISESSQLAKAGRVISHTFQSLLQGGRGGREMQANPAYLLIKMCKYINLSI